MKVIYCVMVNLLIQHYISAAALGVTTTPDLRGYFISGILEEESRTTTNTIGAAHRHRYTATPSEGFVGANPLITAGTFNVQIGGPFQSSPSYYIQSTRATGSSSLGPGNETRPVNMSVTYLMRVA